MRKKNTIYIIYFCYVYFNKYNIHYYFCHVFFYFIFLSTEFEVRVIRQVSSTVSVGTKTVYAMRYCTPEDVSEVGVGLCGLLSRITTAHRSVIIFFFYDAAVNATRSH